MFFRGLEVSPTQGRFPFRNHSCGWTSPCGSYDCQDAFSNKHQETLRKKRKNQQGLLFTGPEGYIAHLGTHSEVTGRELYYFCSFSVNLKLFKISLEKNALQKMFKKVIEKIWCLVRNCFLVQSQLSSHFVSTWWKKHGTTLILFYKRTSPIQRVSTCTA